MPALCHRARQPGLVPGDRIPASTMSLLGGWLVTRVPRREPLPGMAALACAAVVLAMFGLSVTSFHDMLASSRGMRIAHPCPAPVRNRPGQPTGPVHCSSPTGQPARAPVKPAGQAGS